MTAPAPLIPPSTALRCYYTNPTSLNNKLNEINFFLVKHDFPEILFFTETWFRDDSPAQLENYYLFHNSRYKGHGGGVAIYVRNDVKAYEFISDPLLSDTGLEQTWITIEVSSKRILVGCLYRPPSSKTATNHAINLVLARSAKLVDCLKFDNLLLVGDFNFPNITWDSSGFPNIAKTPAEKAFTDIVQTSLLTQMVQGPTLGSNQLDLIFTSDPSSIFDVEIGPPLGNTQKNNLHNSLIWTLHVSDTPSAPSSRVTLDLERTDTVNLNYFLATTDWESLFSGNNINTNYDLFLKIYSTAVAKFVPIKRVLTKSKPNPKWFSPEVNKATKEKYSSFARLRASPAHLKAETKARYNAACRHVKKVVFNAVRDFETNLANLSKKNPKLLYSYVNKQKQCKETIRALKAPSGKTSSNVEDIVNILSDQYYSVFSKPSPSGLTDHPTSSPNLAHIINPSETFSISAVHTHLRALDKHKPAGTDGLRPAILLMAADGIAKPLSMIFTQSFTSGEVPRFWSEANITPIYKKGRKTDPSNYRPISLTSAACKIMERLIRDNLFSFLKSESLLHSSQHGFISGKSCATNLLESLDIITDALDLNLNVVMILLDFAKAFDKVNHSKLIHKLKYFGFDEQICNWIGSFLTNRRQRVVIGETRSRWHQVLSGVSQGSVLGPLLFLLYINDMPSLVSHYIKLFADDTKLLGVIKSQSDIDRLQNDLNKLVAWSHKWDMCFNEEKCKVLFFEKRYHRYDELNSGFVEKAVDPSHPVFTMTDLHGKVHELEEVSTERDLGILINRTLSCKDQIAQTKSKAFGILGTLKRTFKTWSTRSFRLLYSTFVRPHLEFCAVTWSPYTADDVLSIEAVQKQATKLVPCLRDLSYVKRLEALKLPTLAYRRRRGDLIQFYKIYTDLNKISLITPLAKPHSANLSTVLRSQSESHRVQLPTTFGCREREFFFINRAIMDWNKLPVEICLAETIQAFKTQLDAYFIAKNEVYSLD